MVTVPDVIALLNRTRDYAWGSATTIPALLGEEPTGEPVAELWVGAHPGAPSRWAHHPLLIGLDQLIAADPEQLLGAAVTAAFGPRLPFLLKLLAVERPLSLQVHPSLEQARLGFAQEQLAGISLDAPFRNYKDDNHKPEMLCALTDFDALCGFRTPEATVELLATLPTRALDPLRSLLKVDRDLRAATEYLLSLDVESAATLVDDIVSVAQAADTAMPWAAERRWLVALAEHYPGDIGVAIALLLNLVHVAPGQALFVAAGQLHAYLTGFGVEVLANSDNVLRGGLTPKHVDVAELLAITDFAPAPANLAAGVSGPDGQLRFPAAVPDFELSRCRPGSAVVACTDAGPQLALCTSGTANLRGGDGSQVQLSPGRAAFIPAGRTVDLAGEATVFRCRSGQGVAADI